MCVGAEAIYARQSVDKKESLSIEGQIELCKKECKDTKDVFIYQDRGYSGKNTKRPGFKEMIEDVKQGKIEKIIVYRLDRLSRSIVDFGQIWSLLEKNGVEFVSINEKFDTSTPMGRAMIYIIMVFAQLERETIGERVRDNYYARIQKGHWPGGIAPYGFCNIQKIDETGRQVPSLKQEKEIEIVKWIFQEYEKENASLGKIARSLTEAKVACKKRWGWDNVALSRILHSPVYVKADEKIYNYFKEKGNYVFSNTMEEFDGKRAAHIIGKGKEGQVLSLTNFEGTISSNQWLNCQRKLERNKQIGNSGKGKYTFLSGLIKCGKCGYSLNVRCSRKKLYLGCSGHSNLHICDVKKISFSIEELEDLVRTEMEFIFEQCQKSYFIKRDGESTLESLEKKIAALVHKLAETSGVSSYYIKKEIEKIDEEKKELLNKKEKIQRGAPFFSFHQLSFEEKKLAVYTFIDKIFVTDFEIEIVWKG